MLKLVFAAGNELEVVDDTALGLLRKLTAAESGQTMTDAEGVSLPNGWAPVQLREGVVYVNPRQVTYIRDF